MEKIDSIWNYHKLIQQVYKDQNLNCLSGLNRESILDGKPLLVWHQEVTRKAAIQFNNNLFYFNNIDELLNASDDLLYFTASLFLYRPFINNPLEDSYFHGNGYIFPNYQNFYSKQYSMFADVAAEKTYNFWDRIGDLIASFFPEKIKATDIYFHKAIEIIPQEYHKNEDYQWLLNFKENEFKKLNYKRKQIVHYLGTEVSYRYMHLTEAIQDRRKMEILQSERNSLADFYKYQIDCTIEGLKRALSLLEFISEDIFKNID